MTKFWQRQPVADLKEEHRRRTHAALVYMMGVGQAGSGAAPVSAVTWNPLDKGSGVVLSNGDLTATASTAQHLVRATTSHTTTGKYYFEVVMDTVLVGSNAPKVGIGSGTLAYNHSLSLGGGDVFASIQSDGAFCYNNAAYKSSGVTYASGNRCNVAVDFGANLLWFGKNGVYILSGNPATGANPTWTINAATAYFPVSTPNNSSQVTAHFSSASWVDAAPSGFVAW